MAYNPQELKTKITPDEGEKVNAQVTDIREGMLGELVDPEILVGWRNADPSSRAIEVTAKGMAGAWARRILQLPQDNFVNPRSNLGKWKKIYGEYPTIGQTVTLIADKNGYYQFLI